MSDPSNSAREPATSTGIVGSASPPLEHGADRAIARLRRLRWQAKGLLVTHRLGWIIASIIAATVVGGTLDYFLRSPDWLRLLGLLGAVSLLGWALWHRVRPALAFSPRLEDLALLVEQRSGQPVRGLASGVGLAERPPVDPASAALAAPVVRDAARLASQVHPLRVLRWGPAGRAVGVMGLGLFAAFGLTVTQPALAWIGAQRMLAPWTGAQWPKRFMIHDLVRAEVHPTGTALVLQGALLATPVDPQRADVEAQFRVRVGEVDGPERRVAMTPQSRTATIAVKDELGAVQQQTGTVFERVLEAAALAAEPARDGRDGSAAPADAAAPVESQIQYRLVAGDDATEWRTIRLIQPPAVRSAALSVQPPAYARQTPTTRELGPGNDERASAGEVLAGSVATLTLNLNKPVTADAAQLAAVFGPAAAEVLGRSEAALDARTQGAAWTLRWTVREPLRLAVRLTDEFGIAGVEDAVYRLDARADRPPEAVVTLPAEDADVLPTATVALTGEARDDVALASAALEQRLARQRAGSTSGVPEPIEQPQTITSVTAPEAPPTGAPASATADQARSLTVSGTITPADVGARPGDEVWITLLATDRFQLDGATHEPVRSRVRKLRVISPEQLVEQLWTELEGVRRSAVRTAEQQQAARDLARAAEQAARAAAQAAANSAASPEEQQRAAAQAADQAAAAEREQTAINQQAQRMAESVARVQERARENALTDQTLSDILRSASQEAEQAQRAAAEAADQLRQARAQAQQGQEAQQRGGQAGAEQRRQAAEAEAQARQQAQQQQTRAENALEQLATTLDRGQDAWAARRALERLAAEQKAARERAAELDEQLRGLPRENLSPEQQQASEQLAQKQQELSRRAEQAIADMQARARQMQQNDPQQASALQEAARRGQREQVAQQMQQAAQQIRNNQMNQAQQGQQRAEAALEQMLQEMRQSERTRDAVLRRELASLIQAIEALIGQQTAALDSLTAAIAAAGPGAEPALAGLDQPMIRLHAGTLAAVDQARAAGREAAEAGELLRSAAAEQIGAVGALRAKPADAQTAERSERQSLKLLSDAKKAAETAARQAQRRDEARKRAELKAAYTELLEGQKAVRDAVAPLVGKPADRRARRDLAEQGEKQTGLKTRADELLNQTQELREAATFELAHRRLDEAMDRAAKMMADANTAAGLRSATDSAVRTLERLVTALSEPEDNPEFRENEEGEQQGGGGGGGNQRQQLIPDFAELLLLRGLQEDALTVTREAADAGDAAGAQAAREDATRLQGELAAKAKAMLERMQQQGGPRGPGGPGGPREEGGQGGGNQPAPPGPQGEPQ
ncbi:MAG: hypothetical protein LW650_07570 [Planctomycetaceae bacterium]|jgi:hypothetical protein|nr:hypothetical protein [Phycisphaerales bacterium]MCE2653352.1 hypothetical protein [Planctomycetaceae bacterium]